MSNYLFHAKTYEGYTFKILMELLQQIINTACFELNENGMFLCMMDSHRKVLVDVGLYGENFNIFEVSEPMYIGVNLIHFYRMLKSIKKKDGLELFIEESNPSQLQFIIYPQDNNCKAHNTVQLQNIQNMCMPLPGPYHNSIIVQSNAFQCSIKELSSVGTQCTIQMQKHSFTVNAENRNMFSKKHFFGEENDDTPVITEAEYQMELFTRIFKISGFCINLIISGAEDLPFRIKTNVGQLGQIKIYIKSNELRQNEET